MSITINNKISTFSLFRGSVSCNEKYKQTLEKRAYIESKTESLNDLCMLAFLGTFISGLLGGEQVLSKKESNTPKKTTIALAIATVGIFITKFIKQMKLSREYDKEHGHDSENKL